MTAPKLAGVLDRLPLTARVVEGGQVFDHALLRQLYEQALSTLSGSPPGARVVLDVGHGGLGLAALAAASALGLEAVLPYDLSDCTEAEFAAVLERTRATAYLSLRRRVSDGGLVWRTGDETRPSADRTTEPLDRLLLLFTSGTSGPPKMVSLSESLVWLKIRSVGSHLGFRDGMVTLQTGLLSNTTGIIFGFGTLLAGGTLVIPPGRNPSTWPDLVHHHSVTHLMLRPAAVGEFASAGPPRLSSIETLALGGGPAPLPALAALRQRVSGRIIEGYGLSETFGPFLWNESDPLHGTLPAPSGAYLLGTPDDSVRIAAPVVEGGAGELTLDPAIGLMNGYCFEEDPTHSARPESEVFRTGDIVYLQNGRYWLVGRESSSVLTANGHKCQAEGVESLLDQNGYQTCLVQAPERSRGSVLVVATDLTDDGLAIQRIADLLQERTSPEARPDYLASIPAIPVSVNGKPQRAALSAWLRDDPLATLVPFDCRSHVCALRHETTVTERSLDQLFAAILDPAHLVSDIAGATARVLAEDRTNQTVWYRAAIAGRQTSWTSHRRIDRPAGTVLATLEPPPVGAAGITVEWRLTPVDSADVRVSVTHTVTFQSDLAVGRRVAFADTLSANTMRELRRLQEKRP
ncbi:MAG: AMP-binding protein [Propionibacteriaceae bacterium]|nr:AMP-binding protein [Propionibacteriaceae bacterium]